MEDGESQDKAKQSYKNIVAGIAYKLNSDAAECGEPLKLVTDFVTYFINERTEGRVMIPGQHTVNGNTGETEDADDDNNDLALAMSGDYSKMLQLGATNTEKAAKMSMMYAAYAAADANPMAAAASTGSVGAITKATV